MSPGENPHLKRVLYAYHEAGHAVVWHVVGGLVEEASIAHGMRNEVSSSKIEGVKGNQ